MAVPWHVTTWTYNFKGSISSRRKNRRIVTILRVYFLCILLALFIAWAVVEDKGAKQVILFFFWMISIPVFFVLTIYLVHYSYRFGYWLFYRYIRKQRKALDENNNDLKSTLQAFFFQIPNVEELDLIEKRNCQYLHNTQKQINEIMNIDSELMLTGSSAERYSIPFTNVQEISERHNSCIPMITFCLEESLQREELRRMSNWRHALLSDCDCMISPKEDMVSFSEGKYQYQAVVKLFPHYIITDGDEELHSKTLKKNLLEMVEKIDVNSIPWHLSGDENKTNNFVDLEINGPALTLKLGSSEKCESTNLHFYADITYSLKCPEWPDEVSDWGHRPNTKWPNPEEIKEIKSLGCHFVPKAHSDDLRGLTWRISFSRAEVELSKLVPEAARMCLVGLKVITKDYLAVACKKLKSYHLKCIFLHTLEITDPSIWTEDNLLFCFERLLKS